MSGRNREEPAMATRTTLESCAYTALRIVSGLLFAFHGLQKLLGMYGGQTVQTFSLPWFAGVIELVGGLLLLIGLFTRPVAFLCSGEMAAAYFMVHFPQSFWPIQNGGELAALYCFVFLHISARGAGPLSLDRLIRGKA
jgi:putative oxidoreductase